MIAVTLLGTGSPMPSPNRAGPATLVSAGDEHYLVDTGRGAMMRLAGAGLGAPNLSAVLLTHLHSDHITDLNDVITTRWVMTFEPTPLTIVGPVGTQGVVDHLLAMLEPDIGYRIAHHQDLTEPPSVEVIEVSEGEIDLPGDLTITCGPTHHKPVEPTVGYRFEQSGDDGSASVVAAGDTTPCDGLDSLCDGADALVHTVIRKDVIEGHPAPADAGHPGLPLLTGGGGPDRDPRRGRHPDPDPLRARDSARRPGRRLAGARRRALRRHRRDRRRPPPGGDHAELTDGYPPSESRVAHCGSNQSS